MTAILICGHSSLASSILDTAEMLVGRIENSYALDFKKDMTPEELEAQMKDAIEGLDTERGILIMVDLFGGTPFNVAYNVIESITDWDGTDGKISLDDKLKEKADILTGINVPMLVEIIALRKSMGLEGLRDVSYEAAREGIKSLSSLIGPTL